MFVRQSSSEDGCYRERNPEFCSVGGARSENKILFCVFRVPMVYAAHSLQKTVLPKPVVPMESRDYVRVTFDSLESL